MRSLFVMGAVALMSIAASPLALAQSARGYDRLQVVRAPGAAPIECKATVSFFCGAQGCETEQHPEGLPVEFSLKTAEGKGYLCTYTYCRSFTLMGWRGRPNGTGLLWSSASGSTPPADKTPTYDYSLTLAEDGGRFTLSAVGNGAVSGFAGSCSTPSE